MHGSAGWKKAVVALVAIALFAGGVYWSQSRPVTPPATVRVSLLKMSLDELGPLSEHDREVLATADALIRDGRYPQAYQALRQYQTTDLGAGHLRAMLLRGRCELAGDNFPAAFQSFAIVAESRPDDPDAHRGLAAAFDAMGAVAQAEKHCRRVAELDPTDVRALLLLARTELELERFTECEETTRQALDRAPPATDRDVLKRFLADALLGQKRFEEAVAASSGLTDPAARVTRAECLRSMNRPGEAAVEIDTALATNPTDPKIRARLLLERGRLRADAGDDPAAIAAFEDALRAEEHNLLARLQLAQALRRTGQTQKADAADAKFKDSETRRRRVSDLLSAAINRPTDAAVRRELAEACRAIDRPAEAEMWLAAAAAVEAAK